MSTPEPRHPATGLLVAGRYGAEGADPVVIDAPRRDIVQLAARRGRSGELSAAFAAAFGFPLPAMRGSGESGGVSAWAIQPNAWMVVGEPQGEGVLARRLAEVAGDLGAVADQSHGRVVISLSGARAREVMSRIARIDLHASVFATGSVAATQIADLMGVLRQADAAPTYEMIVFSTFVGSFLHGLIDAALTTGFEVPRTI